MPRPLAAAAALAGGGYVGGDGDEEEAITDLIADLLHLAAALSLDPVKLLDLATIHYEDEADEGSNIGHAARVRRVQAAEAAEARTEWCPHCREYHAHPIGERTDAGKLTKPCPRKADDPNWRLA